MFEKKFQFADLSLNDMAHSSLESVRLLAEYVKVLHDKLDEPKEKEPELDWMYAHHQCEWKNLPSGAYEFKDRNGRMYFGYKFQSDTHSVAGYCSYDSPLDCNNCVYANLLWEKFREYRLISRPDECVPYNIFYKGTIAEMDATTKALLIDLAKKLEKK